MTCAHAINKTAVPTPKGRHASRAATRTRAGRDGEPGAPRAAAWRHACAHAPLRAAAVACAPHRTWGGRAWLLSEAAVPVVQCRPGPSCGRGFQCASAPARKGGVFLTSPGCPAPGPRTSDDSREFGAYSQLQVQCKSVRPACWI